MSQLPRKASQPGTPMADRRSVLRKLQKFVPTWLIDNFIRKTIKLPAMCHEPTLLVKIAENQVEIEKALTLLHRCYVERKMMTASPDNLRCNVFTFLPESTTLICTYRGQVVGTLSLILDSGFGLPSDLDYSEQNDLLRAVGSRVIQVTNMAVHPDFRHTGHAISFSLMRYAYFYCRHWMQGTFLTFVTHPSSEAFYRALFKATRLGSETQYSQVEKSKGIFMQLEVSQAQSEEFTDLHGKKSDFAQFFTNMDARMIFPPRKEGQVLDPVMTPEMLKYFLTERTNLLESLNPERRHRLLTIYRSSFGDLGPLEKYIPRSRFIYKRSSEYRMPTFLSTMLIRDHQKMHSGSIFDLTSNGCYISSPIWNDISIGEKVMVSFRFAGKQYRVAAEVRWINPPGPRRNSCGFGLKFAQPIHEAKALMVQWKYSSAA